jgi:hypothetical protein
MTTTRPGQPAACCAEIACTCCRSDTRQPASSPGVAGPPRPAVDPAIPARAR